MLEEKERQKAIDYLVGIKHPKLTIRRLLMGSGPEDEQELASLAAEAVETRRRLEALPNSFIEQEYREALAKRQALESKAREAQFPLNAAHALEVNYQYWAAMEYWSLDESVALVMGRNPKAVTWGLVQSYLNLSAFAKAYAGVRELAQRSELMAFGQHAIHPSQVLAWIRSNAAVLPMSAAPVAAAITNRLAPSVEPLVAPKFDDPCAQRQNQVQGPASAQIAAAGFAVPPQTDASSAPAAPPPELHTVKPRADPLSAVLKRARNEAVDATDWFSVWSALIALAQSEDRPAPLLGYVEGEGVQYQKDLASDPVGYLTRDAYRKRHSRKR